MTIDPVPLVDPSFHLNKLYVAPQQHPTPIITKSTPYNALNPIPGVFQLQEIERVVIPLILRQIKEVAEAILTAIPATQEEAPSPNPQPVLPRPSREAPELSLLREKFQPLITQLKKIAEEPSSIPERLGTIKVPLKELETALQKVLLLPKESAETLPKQLTATLKQVVTLLQLTEQLVEVPNPQQLQAAPIIAPRITLPEPEQPPLPPSSAQSLPEKQIPSEPNQPTKIPEPVLQELRKILPPLLRNLREILPQIPQGPVAQAANPQLPTAAQPLTGKTFPETARQMPTRLEPSQPGEKVPAREPVFRPASSPILQQIEKTYPYYPVLTTPLAIAPVPIVIAELPNLRFEKTVTRFEFPPFSTDIPFAFIVPYFSAFPIVNNDFSSIPIKPKVDIEGEDDEVGEGKESLQLLAYIPEGETWYGDPFDEGAPDERPLRKSRLEKFAIGIYPVTNEQYVDYLNGLAREGRVQIQGDGKIYSSDGTLLCQTKHKSYADIEIVAHKRYTGFQVAQGKGLYPVVCVTYFGALAFCQETGFRLPSEIEWEKAAGIKIKENGKVQRKFRFGVGRDFLNKSLANYESPCSTPVGFYNGKTLVSTSGRSLQTSDGASPFGCYDMSGNVWEWTSTCSEDYAVIKGGAFHSPMTELRVSARRRKKQDSLDMFTGFRVAL